MANLVRLWTTVPLGTFTNLSIGPGTPIEVAIDVEAESAEFASGAAFAVGAIAINKTTGETSGPLLPAGAPPSPPYGVITHMAGAEWDTVADQFRYTVPGGFGASNDIIEICAFLRVGVGVSVEAHFAFTHVIRI